MILDLKWFALLTRSNFEQTVYNSFVKKKFDTFLPKTRRQSKRKDRKLMIETPLFPGYVFVKSTQEPSFQLSILKTTGVVRLLGNTEGPVPVPSQQIESLKMLTSANMDLVTGATVKLVKGDPVMILEGAMAGLQGEFIRYKGKTRVIIKIGVLGQFAGVDIDETNVEKIPNLSS